jgi:hypothetical protein
MEKPVDHSADMAKAMAEILTIMGPVREAVVGYKRQLEMDGHSSGVVDELVVQFHRTIMIQLTSGLGK